MRFEIDTIEQWLIALSVLAIGFFAIKLISVAVKKTLRKTSLDPVLHRFVVNGTSVILGILLLSGILSYLGVTLSAIVAMIGVAGAAIALALKDSLGNIAGGMIIIASKPFKKGDTVESGGIVGRVEQIDLLFTTLMTFDNKVVYIPNGNLSTSTIINYSAEDKRRVDCKFGISVKSSVSDAKEILYVVAEQSEMILKEPTPLVGVSEQSDGIVYLDMKVWCATDNYLTVKYFIEENVKLAFDEGGIDTQVRHLNVHVKK